MHFQLGVCDIALSGGGKEEAKKVRIGGHICGISLGISGDQGEKCLKRFLWRTIMKKRLRNIVPERSEMQKEWEQNGEILLAPLPWPNHNDQRQAHWNRTSPTDRGAQLQR